MITIETGGLLLHNDTLKTPDRCIKIKSMMYVIKYSVNAVSTDHLPRAYLHVFSWMNILERPCHIHYIETASPYAY